MPVPSVLDRWNGSSRATRHLLIRARSASGPVARGGHVTSSGSQPRVCRRPARTFVLPAPRVPDGLTITRSRRIGQTPRAPRSSCRITASSSWHRTLLDEHFRVEGRRTWFETLEEMQTALDQYLVEYNTKRPHQGRGMNGRTPITAFIDGIRKENTPQPNPARKAA